MINMKVSPEFLDKLYPKYKCPNCKDWFHMPFKYCKCDLDSRMKKSKIK